MNELHPIFDECCAKPCNTSRYAIASPFRDGDYIYATDGRIIVRLHDPECKHPSDVKGPPSSDLPWSADRGAPMRMPTLPDRTMRSCPRCNCNTLLVSENFDGVRIGDRIVRPEHARILARHGAIVYPRTGFRCRPIPFTVGEIEGLLVPMDTAGWNTGEKVILNAVEVGP